jgi:SAM-dependent methyltransferase
MSNLFEKFIKLSENHDDEIFSKFNNIWDYSRHNNVWVGGLFEVNNSSGGYHGILKQWWEHYIDVNEEKNVLLVSEGNGVKKYFEDLYPKWSFKTTGKYYDIQGSEPDIIADICENDSLPKNEFDLVICQATLEHVYNPWGVIKNFEKTLKSNGILLMHTHPPGFRYHSFPRDYFRFMKDWWYDIPVYLNSLNLLELYMDKNEVVFTTYIKNKN